MAAAVSKELPPKHHVSVKGRIDRSSSPEPPARLQSRHRSQAVRGGKGAADWKQNTKMPWFVKISGITHLVCRNTCEAFFGLSIGMLRPHKTPEADRPLSRASAETADTMSIEHKRRSLTKASDQYRKAVESIAGPVTRSLNVAEIQKLQCLLLVPKAGCCGGCSSRVMQHRMGKLNPMPHDHVPRIHRALE